MQIRLTQLCHDDVNDTYQETRDLQIACNYHILQKTMLHIRQIVNKSHEAEKANYFGYVSSKEKLVTISY